MRLSLLEVVDGTPRESACPLFFNPRTFLCRMNRNSAAIATRHYLQVTDADYDRAKIPAAQIPACWGRKVRRSNLPRLAAESRKKRSKPLVRKGLCLVVRLAAKTRHKPKYPLGESNPCSRTENPMSWATRRRGLLTDRSRRPLTGDETALHAGPKKPNHLRRTAVTMTKRITTFTIRVRGCQPSSRNCSLSQVSHSWAVRKPSLALFLLTAWSTSSTIGRHQASLSRIGSSWAKTAFEPV